MTSPEWALRRPTLLIILDGFGVNPNPRDNAITLADTPNFDHYFANYPMTTLQASGRGVGLPEGQMGNSEVGHMTIGCGSVVKQDLVRIDEAVGDHSFDQNSAILGALRTAREQHRPLHLIGLVSDGGVHSHIDHLKALLRLCKIESVVPHLHMITDGRDTAPQRAVEFVAELELLLQQAGGHIVTVMGRYYAMDRDQRWDRVQLAFEAIVDAKGEYAESALSAIQAAYEAGLNDEFIRPTCLPLGEPLQAEDLMLFFNFRNDRAREISATLAIESFDQFDRGADFKPIKLTTMTHYDDALGAEIAFAPDRPKVTLGSVISELGLRQLHCAETEKYAHVTFFLNGGRETPFDGEDRCLIQSPRVATYDLKPEMSAAEVADAVIDGMENARYDFIVVNFANGDMVGHTAVREAVIAAVEVLDQETGRVLKAAQTQGYSVVLTSDHGNCDEMTDPESGQPQPQHSKHPVPCLIIDDGVRELLDHQSLSSIAPTVLQLMGIPSPAAMSGKSLIENTL